MALILKIKEEQGVEGRQTLEPEKAHSTSGFAIVAKFGDHVLSRLAFSLSNVIRQVDENSSFLRIQYLAFGSYLVVLNVMFCLVVPRLFRELAFLCIRYS